MNTKDPLFYKINKDVFFNTINFPDQNQLLNAVKLDWKRSDIWFNREKQVNYAEFLEKITTQFPEYLDKVLLICNQNAHFSSYNKIFDIINKYDYHFATVLNEDNNYDTVKTEFNFTYIIKQGIVTNTYQIFKVEGEIKVYKKMKISTIIDFCTADPVLIKIEYLD